MRRRRRCVRWGRRLLPTHVNKVRIADLDVHVCISLFHIVCLRVPVIEAGSVRARISYFAMHSKSCFLVIGARSTSNSEH